MRVCVVSHAYVEQHGYLPSLSAMAALPGVTLGLVTPESYSSGRVSAKMFDGAQLGFECYAVPIHFGPRQGAFLYNHPRLKRVLAEFKPDVLLHEQEVFALSAGQVAMLARSLSVPLSMFVWENLPRDLAWPRRQLARFVMSRCAGLIAGSTAAARVHLDWGFRGSVLTLPQMGVPSVVDPPRLGRRHPTHLQVAFAGRLVPSKGVDTLLGALALLRSRNVPFQCVIAGNGPEKEALMNQASELELDRTITFTGSLPMEAVADLLAQTDILVLPSRRTRTWEEQFGRVLVEAMAKATVVIGSRTGAIPEVIANDDLLFEADDQTGLAELLVKLASEPAFFNSAQIALWQRARDCYRNDVLAQKRIAFLATL